MCTLRDMGCLKMRYTGYMDVYVDSYTSKHGNLTREYSNNNNDNNNNNNNNNKNNNNNNGPIKLGIPHFGQTRASSNYNLDYSRWNLRWLQPCWLANSCSSFLVFISTLACYSLHDSPGDDQTMFWSKTRLQLVIIHQSDKNTQHGSNQPAN